jgi:hypothetical protein
MFAIWCYQNFTYDRNSVYSLFDIYICYSLHFIDTMAVLIRLIIDLRLLLHVTDHYYLNMTEKQRIECIIVRSDGERIVFGLIF